VNLRHSSYFSHAKISRSEWAAIRRAATTPHVAEEFHSTVPLHINFLLTSNLLIICPGENLNIRVCTGEKIFFLVFDFL